MTIILYIDFVIKYQKKERIYNLNNGKNSWRFIGLFIMIDLRIKFLERMNHINNYVSSSNYIVLYIDRAYKSYIIYH